MSYNLHTLKDRLANQLLTVQRTRIQKCKSEEQFERYVRDLIFEAALIGLPNHTVRIEEMKKSSEESDFD